MPVAYLWFFFILVRLLPTPLRKLGTGDYRTVNVLNLLNALDTAEQTILTFEKWAVIDPTTTILINSESLHYRHWRLVVHRIFSFRNHVVWRSLEEPPWVVIAVNQVGHFFGAPSSIGVQSGVVFPVIVCVAWNDDFWGFSDV